MQLGRRLGTVEVARPKPLKFPKITSEPKVDEGEETPVPQPQEAPVPA